AARDAGLRAARHDPRARRRRARRDEPAGVCDARRLRDRLRVRLPGRGPADRPEPVPAFVPVRRRDPRPADPPRGPVHARGPAGGGAGMRRVRAALELLAPIILVVLVALYGTTVSSSTQTYVITTLVNVVIVVALYSFIGN